MSWAGALAAIHITNTLTRNLTDLQRISVKMTSAFLSNIFFSFFVIHFIRRLRVFSCAMKLTSFSLGFFGVIRCYFQKKRRTKLAFKMHDRCLAKSREKKISFLASTIMSRHCCWYVMKHSTYTTIQFARQKVLIVMLMWIVLYIFFVGRPGFQFDSINNTKRIAMDILIALFCSMSVGNCLFAIFQLNAWAHKSIYAECTKKLHQQNVQTQPTVSYFRKPNRPNIFYTEIFIYWNYLCLYFTSERCECTKYQ